MSAGSRITSEAGRRVNVTRPLTHSLDLGEEGLAMQATRTCSVEGCEKVKFQRDLCAMHHSRLKRTGTTDLIPRKTPEREAERFWRYVDKTAGPDACWPWLGTVTNAGYGQFMSCRQRYLAHRFAYEITIGPIPAGLEIDHVRARGCTRTDCVNPAHLEAVTPQENKLRSNNVAGMNARKTTCPQGHPFDKVGSSGERQCSTCQRANWQTYNRKRAAK